MQDALFCSVVLSYSDLVRPFFACETWTSELEAHYVVHGEDP